MPATAIATRKETNAFTGRKDPPAAEDLAKALGRSKAAWDQLIDELASEFGTGIQEWKSYSPKAGWSLRCLRGKRTIVWLAPCSGCFQVVFILGEKAMRAAREGVPPAHLLQALNDGVKYPEGTSVRLIVRSAKDLPAVKRLAAAKLDN